MSQTRNDRARPTAERKRGRPSGTDGPDLKVALLRAAIDLFADRGFDGVSLSQIASKAEADVGLTRYYFGSKASLWNAAMNHLSECFVKDLSDANTFESGSKADALKALIKAFVIASARWPQVSRVIVFDGDKSDARGAFIKNQLVAPFFHLLSDLIEDAKAQGAIPDVSTRTIFFMITHGGSFPMALPALTNAFPGEVIGSDAGLNAHADAIVDLIFK
ncbi:MAG: TetR/AcrR family transcriptional regulator [Pseudomonadota bacterium]